MGKKPRASAPAQSPRTAPDAPGATAWGSITELPVALAVFDRDMRYLAVSRRWLRDYGLEGRDVVGASHYAVFPEISERWKAIHQRGLAGETVVAQEDHFERLDGVEQWLNWEVRPWHGVKGTVEGIEIWTEDVTTRVTAEAALRDQAREFQALAEGMPQLVWMSSPAGVNSYSSPQWTSYTGQSVVTSAGEGWSAVFHPEDLPRVWSAWRRALKDGGEFEVESRLRRADGVYRWFLVRALPQRDARGQVAKWIGSCTDVDDLKRAEATLALQTAALEAAANAIVITDRDGVVQWANAALHALTGFTQADAVGQTLGRLLNSGHQDAAFYRHLWDTILGGGVWHGELVNKRKDGRVYPEEMTITPLTNAEGAITHFIAVKQDISERKRADEARMHQAAELAESQRIARIGSWEWMIATNVIAWSDGMNHLLARAPGSPPPTFAELPQFYPPESWRRLGVAIASAVEAGTPYDLEAEMLRGDGATCWTTTRGEAVRGADGTVVKLRGTVLDITARKRAEEERAHMEAQLQQAQKLESVGLLAGGVAHDFNNMLGVILGSAELALGRMDAAQPGHEFLLEIRKAAIRSAELTRQLLAFARQQTIAPVVIDLNVAVSATLGMLQRLIGEDISLHWQPAAALWPVLIDRSQLDQMLTNLCVNARHAIADIGTVTIATANVVADAAFCVVHAESTPGDYVRLSVRDTGSGMDAATMARVFEPFFTTKGVGEGTGLGLATVYGAVKQNRGFVTVSSRPGEGATFEIYLPRQGAAPTPARDTGTMAAGLHGTETILLVEDEPSLNRLVTKTLEAQGYVVLAASNAADALRLATAHAGEIQLLLSDVVMPGMNGRDLADALRRIRPTLRPLFMSGHTADVIAIRGHLAPGVDFIEKPFTPVTLAAKVRTVLDRA